MSRLSVIILNWNGLQHLGVCLNALGAQTFRDFEAILVDNGSTDGSAAYVREKFPWVRLLELPENVGFAEGNNRGLAVAGGDFIVTLNNDTKVGAEFLAELVKAVDDPQVGMVAAKMLNFHQTGRIDSVGVRATTVGLGVNSGIGENDAGQYDEPADVFGPCAGAALYRRAMLDAIGFFDPDFFAYYEDLDLAWRARLAGWRGVTAPTAVVYHVHSATGGRMSSFTVYHVHRNKWFVLLKNWPLRVLLAHLPHILLYDTAAVVLALLRGRGVAAVRARLHVLRDLGKLLAKRREVRRMRKISAAAAESLLTLPPSAIDTFFRKMGSGV